MNKKLAIILIVAAFLIGVIGGGWSVGYFYNHFALRFAYISAAAKTVTDVSVLNQLQANNVTNAVRQLDTELDGSLMSLWFFRKDIASSDRDMALKTLRKAKEYRTKFPHKSGYAEIDQTVSNALSLVDVPAGK